MMINESTMMAPSTAPLAFLAWLMIAVATNNVSVEAAHSRTRLTVVRYEKEPEYDRSITTFSPEGRLQQVEYGMEASLRGATTVAFSLHGKIVVLLVKDQEKVYRIDDHVWLVATGLVGDARLLVRVLREYCQSMRFNYNEAPTLEQVAQYAADLQHQLTRQAGARPLGCTSFIVGVDGLMQQTQIFRTDPGGVCDEYKYVAAGQGQQAVMKAMEEQYQELHQQKLSNQSETDQDGNKQNMLKLIQAGMQAMELKKEESVSVWVIRPHSEQKGNMQTTCIQKVNLQNCHKIASELII